MIRTHGPDDRPEVLLMGDDLPDGGREQASQFVDRADVVRLLVVRELYRGPTQAFAWVTPEERESAEKELELLAVGVAAVIERTGCSVDDVLADLRVEIDEVES